MIMTEFFYFCEIFNHFQSLKCCKQIQPNQPIITLLCLKTDTFLLSFFDGIWELDLPMDGDNSMWVFLYLIKYYRLYLTFLEKYSTILLISVLKSIK